MKALIGLTLIALFCIPSFAQTYLTPQDLGLPLHGPAPSNILCGNYNNDKFLDIARFQGNKLEVYYFQGQGYPCRPQAEKYYNQPIRSIAPAGDPWCNIDEIAVTLQDGTQDTIQKLGGSLDLEVSQGFLPAAPKASPPRHVSDFDFQMVWQSESHPMGMDFTAVGDIDNDGINELVTWWKESQTADTAYMLIYKCTGDNQYTLYMQEPINFYPDVTNIPYVTNLLIDDIDQNGQKEIIFTLQYCYFWEFSAPGVYVPWHSDFTFSHPVSDLAVTDVDRNGVKEITQLGYFAYSAPQQGLMVEEFWQKNAQDSTMMFYQVANINWEAGLPIYWGCFAAGDFDDDDTTEIVLGYEWGISSWQDSWVRYFRYTPGAPNNFVENWLVPNIWATCYCPVIADLDNDGRPELFAGGFGGYSSSSNGFGSAYVWKAFGPDSGGIVWWDTTTLIESVDF